MHLLVAEKEAVFSHESVAAAAGISARTVYRYFPSRDDLLSSLWREFQSEYHSLLPETEEELLQKTGELYRSFDRYEPLVRAYLCSAASQDPEDISAEQLRQSIETCLGNLMSGLDEEHRSQVVAVFQSLCSPQSWQVMRDTGHLSGPQAAKAAQWAMAAIMESLRPRVVKKPPAAAPVQVEVELSPPKAKTPESAGKWKGVYNNPVVAKLKKLMPKE